MDKLSREERRQEVSQRRSKPVKPQRIYFPAQGLCENVEVEVDRPLEFCIEATDSEGNLVEWLTDEWWIQIRSVCKNHHVTIVILPTPGALLDEVVLHQLEMVRRIAPSWRIIGYALPRDAQDQPLTDRWLNTAYDEIRISEQDIAMANGAGDAATRLISAAEKSPRLPGYHQARMRKIPSLPFEMPLIKVHQKETTSTLPS